MKLTKAQREIVFNKYAGKCAYCGCDLTGKWHADHIEPVWRNRSDTRNDLHILENINPACAQCNISKSIFSLEDWRERLRTHLDSLNKYHTVYRLVKAFGLIEETKRPIVFYFETLQEPTP